LFVTFGNFGDFWLLHTDADADAELHRLLWVGLEHDVSSSTSPTYPNGGGGGEKTN
jgi:hypothetical protein